MPRLDAGRLEAWRGLQKIVGEVERGIDAQLRAAWDISLGWFDVLAALRRRGGACRPHDLAEDLRLPASSVSRRLDRLEEEGWIARHRRTDVDDGRAVEVELTRTGRRLWREMNVTYRRAVQTTFAQYLDDDDIITVARIIAAVTPSGTRSSDADRPT